MSRGVILFKSPPSDSTADPFVQQLEEVGYVPHVVEVLSTVSCNEEALEDIVRSGPAYGPGYAGVVITSRRAADAWIRAVHKTTQPGDWSRTPFYVVGETTGSILKQMISLHPTRFADHLVLGGAQAGSSESLGRFVLSHLKPGWSIATRNLLYLTGDKNKDVFHRMMSENRVVVESLMVYKTDVVPDLGEKVASTVQWIEKNGDSDYPTWLIFFAPSSSDLVLPHLRKYFLISQSGYSHPSAHFRCKLGAIGPTTAAFLRSERNLCVDAVPDQPNAKQLVSTIYACDVGVYPEDIVRIC